MVFVFPIEQPAFFKTKVNSNRPVMRVFMQRGFLVRSRQVLEDARLAWSLLENEEDPAKYRVHWVAALALCRAVGHVLDKVDRHSSAALSEAIDAAWKRWSEDQQIHRIFWDFVEDGRNCVLKQYEFRFFSGPTTALVGGQSFTLDDLLFCPTTDGYAAGEDCRDVLGEAISWWEAQLVHIARASEAPR